MSTKLTTIETAQQLPELAALGESKMQSVLEVFKPLSEQLEALRTPYEEIVGQMSGGITPELAMQAKRARLDIVKIRTSTDKARKGQKDFYLQAGRAIDAVAKLFIQDAEALEANLERIETHHERIEKQRLQDLQTERETELRKYSVDASTVGLCNMAQDVWDAYIGAQKVKYEAWQKHLEEERIENEKRIAVAALHNERREKALPFHDFWSQFERDLNFGEVSQADFDAFMVRIEAAKQAEAERQLQIQAENERLQAEAERQRQIEAERERLRAIKDAEAEAERQKEREAAEAAIKAANEERAREQAKADAERRELEAKIKAKEDAERKAVADAEAKRIQDEKDTEAAKQAELSKGDAAKFADFVADLEALKTKYSFKSAANQKKYADAGVLLSKIIDHVSK